MATIEELERGAVEMMQAEAKAVERLIGHIRDIAVELPDGSHLAMKLAVRARRLERYTEPPNGRYATHELHELERELDEARELYGEDED